MHLFSKQDLLAGLNIISNALSLFVIYKVVISIANPIDAGIWAYVMGVAYAIKIADFGLAALIPKYIAKSIKNSSKIALTCGLVTLFLASVFSLLCDILLAKYGGFLVGNDPNGIVEEISTLAIFAVFFSILANYLNFTLDGFFKSHLRCMNMIASNLCYVIFVFVFASDISDVVVCYLLSQIINFIIALILSSLECKNYEFGLLSIRNFKTIVGDSWRMQTISIFSLAGDLMTKTAISVWTGVSNVLFYEMATKVITQIRTIFVAIAQVKLPTLSKNTHVVTTTQTKFAVKLYFKYGLLVFMCIAISSPIISLLWIGSVNEILVFTLILMGVTNIFLAPIAPIYFYNIALNKMNINLIAQLIIAMINLILLGLIFGTTSYKLVIISFMIALLLGSSYQYIIFYDFKAIKKN